MSDFLLGLYVSRSRRLSPAAAREVDSRGQASLRWRDREARHHALGFSTQPKVTLGAVRTLHVRLVPALARWIAVVAAATVCSGLVLGLPAFASAAVTIGADLSTTPSQSITCGPGCDIAQIQTLGANQAAPFDGVVVRWRVKDFSGPMKLRVIRPFGGSAYTFVSSGPVVSPTSAGIETFPARLSINTGDYVGVELVSSTSMLSFDSAGTRAGDEVAIWQSTNPDGSSNMANFGMGSRLYINGDVEPDIDHDGFGDETQDHCPGLPGAVQGCPKADLSITQASSASAVFVGQNVTYALTAMNNGPDPAPGVVISDALPVGATVVSATASSGSCNSSSPTVTCNVGGLASGATAAVALVVTMTSAGSKTDMATVDSATLGQAAQNASGAGDTNPANNSASATTTVIAPVITPAHISNATESNRNWHEPSHPRFAQISKKRAPTGTTFKFSLDKAARIRFDFSQPGRGPKVNGMCLATPNISQHRHHCTRTVIRGTLSFPGHAGVNTVAFQGRVTSVSKLKPGNYTLTITAATPGIGSTSQKLTFTIVQ